MVWKKTYFTNLLLSIVSFCLCLTVYASQSTSSYPLPNTNMTPVRKNYSHLEQPVGPYVHAVKQNGFLFLSGITAFGSSAQNGTIAEQADVVYSTIISIAKKENTDLSNLIKVTIYITSFDDVESLRTSLFKHYGSNLPASSLVQIDRLFSPDLKIEVAAIMAVK